MVDWNVVVNESVIALLKIVLPILITFIIKWIVQVWVRVREQNPTLARMILECAMIGYHAAEDWAHNTEGITGKDKMEYAIKAASDYLKEVYDKIASEETLRSAIAMYGSDEGLFSWSGEENSEDQKEKTVIGFPINE